MFLMSQIKTVMVNWLFNFFKTVFFFFFFFGGNGSL